MSRLFGIISCKITSILTFITDPTQEVGRHFTKFYDKANVFTAAFNKFMGLTSLITAILLHCCFISILF